MLENPITEISIAMEINYFQLNRAEYFIPVSVKIPGSELALAKKRGAARTLIDFIGEIKDDNGYTQQNVRDKLDIELSTQDGRTARDQPDPVPDRVHAAARQVRHQAAGARHGDREHRHLSGGVHRFPNLEREDETPADQHRRPEQSAGQGW